MADNVVDHPKRGSRTAELPLSHDVVASHAATEFDGDFLYDHDRGHWLGWDGSRWRYEECDECIERARMVCRYFAAQEQRENKREKLGGIGFARGVNDFLKSDPRFRRRSEHFDADPWLLGTPTGTVDLHTGEVRPAARADMITRSTAVSPENVPTPLWDRFLYEATGGDDDLADYLQRVAGYCLTGVTTEQAMFFIHGPGGNGKGVFVHTIRNIISEYGRDASIRTFTEQRFESHPTDLAALKGARLVTAPETRKGQSWDVERIKALTGGDRITARFMRQDDFEFQPQLKLVIMGNHKPKIEDVDQAITRRLRLIPFVCEPVNRNPNLEQELQAEWPGILQWAIDGCVDWAVEGMREPRTVLEQTRGYFEDQDLLGMFLDEWCLTDPMPIIQATSTIRTRASKLYSYWMQFSKDAGENPGSKRTLNSDLQRRGFPKTREPKSGQIEFCGIQLKPDVKNEGVNEHGQG